MKLLSKSTYQNLNECYADYNEQLQKIEYLTRSGSDQRNKLILRLDKEVTTILGQLSGEG